MTSLPCRWIVTGKTSTAVTRSASNGIATGTTDHDLRLTRKPNPIPRNDPSNTKLEK